MPPDITTSLYQAVYVMYYPRKTDSALLRYRQNLKTLSYDTLVLAVGSVSNDFNTEGAKEYCYFLDNRAQADQFQKDLLNTYLDAQYSPTAQSS